MEERIAQWKSRGKEAFAKEDYFNAMYYYNLISTGTHLVLFGIITKIAQQIIVLKRQAQDLKSSVLSFSVAVHLV
jgi:hypothetical protein